MISIVITTMNHLEDLLKPCVRSIVEHTNLEDKEVIISANGCTDGTREYVESLGEPFRLVWSDEPLGFSGANNAGIIAAKGDYIVLLNDDTVLLNNTWIDLLRAPFADSTVGITGPLKFSVDCRGTQRDAMAFWCVMIRKEVFDKIGLLDLIFNPFGFEDLDFCIRAVNAGYYLVQVPYDGSHRFKNGYILSEITEHRFPIWHLGSRTTDHVVSDKKAQENRNINIIYDRYGN